MLGKMIRDLILIVFVVIAAAMAYKAFTSQHELPKPPSVKIGSMAPAPIRPEGVLYR